LAAKALRDEGAGANMVAAERLGAGLPSISVPALPT